MLPYTGLTGVAEWEQKVVALVRRIEELVDSTAGPLRIWMHNQMEQMVAATAPGALVEGGAMTREEIMMYAAMFQATLAFRATPIAVYLDDQGQPVLMTPEAITGYRRMTSPAPLGGGILGAALTHGSPSASPALPLSAFDQTTPDQSEEAP